MIQCDNTSSTISSMSSHNRGDTALDLVPAHLIPITSMHILLAPSSLEPKPLKSNIFPISTDYGLVCLRYVPGALVASLSTISPFSRSLLSSNFSSISVLDYSFVSSWLLSNAYVLDTIGSGFSSITYRLLGSATRLIFEKSFLYKKSKF